MVQPRTVVVLAAGVGKRMKSSTPKALHTLLGRTLLEHVLTSAQAIRAQRHVVVVGHEADLVTAHVQEVAPGTVAALQTEQRGTGHAARVATELLGVVDGTVIVINADLPLLRPETLVALVESHESSGAAATILTAHLPVPYGLGRIMRRPGEDTVDAIVEERDASPEQRQINEVNAGLYAFDGALLAQVLGKLTTANDQGEEYLTDVIGLLVDSGRRVNAHPVTDITEVLGCNDRVELATLRGVLRDRINAAWMRAGVTIIDPSTTWVDVTVTLGRDVIIEPNSHLKGTTTVAEGAIIGPDTSLIDSYVGEGAQVLRAHAVSALIGPRASVGPFTYLRPGTDLGAGSKAGAFVEVKNSVVGAGTKIPHLSYVGDADIGEHTNIGAANVVVNYDGVTKHRTTIGSHVRTGSDTMLVAPVALGDGSYTAAGSVITRDVPPGALGVGRAIQRNVEGWVLRRRGGTDAATAAEAALAAQEPGEQAADASATGRSDTSNE